MLRRIERPCCFHTGQYALERHAHEDQPEGGGACSPFLYYFLEGIRARSRNKDSKIVPDATTSFKTVACLNLTLAHTKIAQFSWLAVAPILVVV
jgi:hypothetical protein